MTARRRISTRERVNKVSRYDWLVAHAKSDTLDCLPWPFSNCDWYHTVRHDGRWTKAHRLMCEIAHGLPPDKGYFALHSCDNKWCVNPQHLRWGTQKDNVADCLSRCRHVYGTKSPRAMLTDAIVKEIRALRENGITYNELERRFGVSKGSIWHAANGSQWKHVK